MFHIVMGQFLHETNVFSSKPADLSAYQTKVWLHNEEVCSFYRGSTTCAGGFLSVLDQEEDVRVTPVIAGNAMPCGPVTREVFDHVAQALLAAVQCTPRPDGILLDLHGAMVTETGDDGEGELLELLRQAVGPDVPIVTTLDLHSNMTPRMWNNANVLINCDYYPHTDTFESGQEAARCLLNILHGRWTPTMCCVKKPLLLPPMITSMSPLNDIIDRVHAYETQPGVITVSVSHGFFCADASGCALTVVAVTDNDPALAERIAGELADYIWSRRREMVRELYSAEDAVREALQDPHQPIVMADTTDNPGGGSSEDGTHLLRALIAAKAKNVAVAFLCDPQSVARAAAAGPGNTVELELGGKVNPDLLGAPIPCRATVKGVYDGKFVAFGPMDGGLPINIGPSAVVDIDGIEVIVASRTYQPKDPAVLYAHGIDPAQKKILVVKSSVHFRSGFSSLAARIIDADCPGLMPQDVKKLTYKRIPRPIFPLDEL